MKSCKWKKIATYGTCGLIAIALTGEGYLAFQGYPTNKNDTVVLDTISCDNGSSGHRELGWINVSGDDVSNFNAGCKVTILKNGARSSRPAMDLRKNCFRVAVLGCSFAFGLGVSDNDTLPWILNERFPNMCFDNYAVTGYGAYQCYQMEKKILEDDKLHYDLIIYAAIANHMCRDSLDRFFFRDKEAVFIYPKLELGQVSERRLLSYDWPGDKYSRIINLAKFANACRLSEKSNLMHRMDVTPPGSLEIMIDNLGKMQELAKSHGARFLFTKLDKFPDEADSKLNSFCTEKGIDSVYLGLPDDNKLPEERIVGGTKEAPIYGYRASDGRHPNRAGNSIYADKLGVWFKDNLPAQCTAEEKN